ncbi:IST1 homolog isoform X2 [Bombina bombina]|nr:IST1 homolog isoform X2 [Bombina bombina]XP_053555428.1 IST1 homolog isoform X2 [Bombina bombina]XP_053555430.1 IST1 homolog isoform X2 [Bombina bombina]XP_053555431.1 IST1 homolog isoform X2 [Bombina bombina]XP_053555432.1 IST1 homolog isoform X2 [Bombina bombina]
MLGSGFKAERLRVNLKLAMNRLKLLEKKKTELALKSRKEIADYLSSRKDERARIRVEHIIREDYLVEAMEILELYCDLLLARYGIIQSMKNLDPGLAEAVSTLIWAAPHLQTEVPELKIVANQLCHKYSKEYGILCQTNQIGTVSNRLMHKLSIETPPRILVEKYLIEIAKNYNVPYEADAFVMDGAHSGFPMDPPNSTFIKDDKKGGNNNRGGGQGNGGAGGGEFRNTLLSSPHHTKREDFGCNIGIYEPCTFLQPPEGGKHASEIPRIPPAYESIDDFNANAAREFGKRNVQENYNDLPLPKLPSVPVSPATHFPPVDPSPYEDIDFEDLSKRLDELKKKT